MTRVARAGRRPLCRRHRRWRLHAEQVIVAVGGYHTPTVPACAANLPATIKQLHARDYRNPESLPPGAVLVIGTGQSGCQIAEDLHLAGRTVHLCVGGAPRAPRFYRGRDAVEWLDRMGHYDMPVDAHPSGMAVRAKANHYLTGRDGGRDIDLRQRALEGMRLHGRPARYRPRRADRADGRRPGPEPRPRRRFGGQHQGRHRRVPGPRAYRGPRRGSLPRALAPGRYRAGRHPRSIWSTRASRRSSGPSATGPIFRGSKISPSTPGASPNIGAGVSPLAGVYFLGLPWLYTWGSGRFAGVARDARFVVDAVLAQQGTSDAAGQPESGAPEGQVDPAGPPVVLGHAGNDGASFRRRRPGRPRSLDRALPAGDLSSAARRAAGARRERRGVTRRPKSLRRRAARAPARLCRPAPGHPTGTRRAGPARPRRSARRGRLRRCRRAGPSARPARSG